LGLVAVSYGRWMGVEGGDGASRLNEAEHRYVKLQFEDDRLVGAITLGFTDHVGALRGLIQSRRRLGGWKSRLMADPTRFMEAWVATLAG
jgi:NAD(P)H-nitrite reductase large subunit